MNTHNYLNLEKQNIESTTMSNEISLISNNMNYFEPLYTKPNK
jgi:hypothetical protein